MTEKPNTYSAIGEVGSFREERTFWKRSRIALKKAPFTAKLGIIIILIYAILAVFAPLIAPYGEAEVFPMF